LNYIAETVGPQGYGVYAVDWASGKPVFTPSKGEPEIVLTPGFVDIHIHGAFGIDFMSASSADLLRLADKLQEQGYEKFCPTTVTASQDAVSEAISRLPDDERIAGFHLEGPFISPKHPGAQPVEWIADVPGDGSWDDVLDHRSLQVVTLAPEKPGAIELIKRLSRRDVAVSMGHSDATYAEALAGADAGARHTTHTFNAMRGFHHREAGLAGFAMLDSRISCELIYDRLHVSRPAAELLIRNKDAAKVIAISDSTMASGLPPGQALTMWGHDCVTAPGEVRLAANGALAGSAITLMDAFKNLGEDFGAEIAIRACSHNPRAALALSEEPNVYLEFSRDFNLRKIRRAT
jgi:N-acetylglucosamine-6-phosphate deacetylase